jgi:hypothetical protein
MLSGDKRASLSSNLLDGKDALSADGAASSSQQRTNGVSKGDGKLRETVLYNKGAASASGFRPRQWSYDAQQPEDHAATVTPFPASASAQRTASASNAVAPNSRARLAMIGLGAFSSIALIASASLFVLSRSQDGGAPAVLPVAPAPSTVVAAAPAAPPAAEVPAPLPSATSNVAAAPPASPATAPPGDAVALAEAQPESSRQAETPPPAEATAAAPTPSLVPAVASTPTQLAPEEIQELVSRGAQLLATGDIAAARVFFERAAEQGSGAAATAAGKTYDPLYLEEAHVRGIRGDPVAAAKWYRRASGAGDKEADLRMKKLIARYAG